jgi:hypothetical protein
VVECVAGACVILGGCVAGLLSKGTSLVVIEVMVVADTFWWISRSLK